MACDVFLAVVSCISRCSFLLYGTGVSFPLTWMEWGVCLESFLHFYLSPFHFVYIHLFYTLGFHTDIYTGVWGDDILREDDVLQEEASQYNVRHRIELDFGL